MNVTNTVRVVIEWAKLREHRLRNNPDDHHGRMRLRWALEALSDEELREVAALELLGTVDGSLADAQDAVEFVEREVLIAMMLANVALVDTLALGMRRASAGKAMLVTAEVA